MRRILVTGMSGTGKSSALAELGRRGFRVVDTDSAEWSEWFPGANGGRGEWLWREDRMAELLAAPGDRTLFVSGCMANQGTFYDRFEAVVLLSAPADVILDRIERRTTNDWGQGPGEREFILHDLETVEPPLRATCTHELDASRSLAEVVADLAALAGESHSPESKCQAPGMASADQSKCQTLGRGRSGRDRDCGYASRSTRTWPASKSVSRRPTFTCPRGRRRPAAPPGRAARGTSAGRRAGCATCPPVP